jgi:hypothetical protein
MLARLQELRITNDEDVRNEAWPLRESRRLDLAYAGAFATYLDGASLTSQAPDATLTFLQDSGIAPELAASLDHWAMARDGLAIFGGHADFQEQVIAIEHNPVTRTQKAQLPGIFSAG